MEDRTRGFLLVVMAAFCLSTVPTAIKLGLRDGADPLQLLAPRMILGAVLLWLWVALTRPHRFRIDRHGLWNCALAGVINTVSLSLFYLGLRRLDASVAILIFTIFPAILLLMLHLRGESVTRRDVIRLTLAVAGVALVANVGGAVDLLGIAFMLGCSTIYAWYVLVVHTRLVSYPASTTAVWIVTSFALIALVAQLVATPAAPLDSGGWSVVIWSAVLGTAVARVASIEGIRLLGGRETVLVMPIETVLSITWASLFLGDRINLLQGVGAALVLTSLLLATAFRRWKPWEL